MTNEGFTISVSANDLAFLCNTVGEAWEAVAGKEEEFRARTGATRECAEEIRARVKELLRKAERRQAAARSKKIKISLSRDELVFFCNSITETLTAVEQWEFQTRTGETCKRGEEILAQLRRTLDDKRGE